MGKNLIIVTFSRFIALTSSVLAGFLLPKIFTVTGYGFFKIFTLYAVYTSMSHFGFVDGILLKMAGKTYKELDVFKVRTYTCFLYFFR